MFFTIPFIVIFIVQSIKLVIDVSNGQQITHDNRSHLFSSGGFPSTHSAMSTSVATLAFLVDGPHLIFTITITFAFLLRYDAINVRVEAGKHAKQLNMLNNKLGKQTSHQETRVRKLKERIGHTPMEVFGGIIAGIIITFLLFQLPFFSL